MSMKIRNIEEKDLPACAEVYARVFAAPPWDEDWTVDHALQRFEHFFHSRGFIGLLAEDEAVLAFVMGNSEPFKQENWFYLREMCTDIPLQASGIGSQLITALLDQLVALDIRHSYLITDRSIPAARFYEKNGFRISTDMPLYIRKTP